MLWIFFDCILMILMVGLIDLIVSVILEINLLLLMGIIILLIL